MDSNNPEPSTPRSRLDFTLLALILGILLFNSPLFTWWTDTKPPWYLSYALWALLIVAIALSHFGTQRDD